MTSTEYDSVTFIFFTSFHTKDLKRTDAVKRFINSGVWFEL